ncbi:hypothetical protein QBC38DRAFT_480858 [Podospora fimiseda]|uniref:Anaphase-promoting complex subunit 1 N-terminal domain-containing protein n=1 Tax=Podospora fimiseda TaxID=252190 RepID=A0AAN7BN03_9PEZI|nr:hypothetical protein QBC38DRAFT_480858 [Podospora fimiseda]
MASVTSLGVHQPTGLRHAIEEEILPPDPSPSLYSWDISIDKHGDYECEDELLTTKNCVLWSRGGMLRKTFKFDLENESVTQALFAYFPSSNDSHRDPNTLQPITKKSFEKPTLSRALVVFLKTQAHIYFLSGTSHVVHMPFEVESACAAPTGVIIQRKPRAGNTAPLSLRLPKVPPHSFISLQPPSSSARPQRGPEFSTETLGNPKVLPIRLSLENLFQPTIEPSDSNWPRLVCLTDPLLEIGLVVTAQDRQKNKRWQKTSSKSHFLGPAEEILHIESVKIPHVAGLEAAGLNIAITVNRETNTYTVWRLSYLEHEDQFVGQKNNKTKPSRRRSSMAPGLASGNATPLQPTVRESFGAPLPGKKSRKSVRIEESAKALDNALNSLDPDKPSDATRRQSRRVSSLLARADLSASQDRSTFTEQPLHQSVGGRRTDSHGSQRNRMSSGYGGASIGGSFNINLNISHDAPVDTLLEELRAGGDFEGFHTMGLDDHDFEGLTQEMLLTKIHTFGVDNTTLRYSLTGKPARTHCKVFLIAAPSTVTNEQGRSLLLVGIQDPVEERLHLLPLRIESRADRTPTKHSAKSSSDPSNVIIFPEEAWKVQNVVDSCKISDGQETIMILSEDSSGGRSLTLQSPWSKIVAINLPLLFLDNLHSLDYAGSYKVNKEVGGRRSFGIGMTGSQVETICHANSRGVVDLCDKEGRFHRIRIKMQPSSLEVQKTLDVCRSVLHSSHADRMIGGWWHVMQWLQETGLQGLECFVTDMEWSAVVILLLASFMVLRHNSETSLRSLDTDIPHYPTRGNWESMQLHERPNSSACPSWLRNKGWQWLLDSGVVEPPGVPGEGLPPTPSFLSLHIKLAQKWISSPSGLTAFDFNGYLPTALNRGTAGREMTASSLMMALHLLVEEQKLNILSPEEVSPGQSDLRAVLCLLARWLGWSEYESIYGMGMQAELDNIESSAPFLGKNIAEPPTEYCIVSWIQERLTSESKSDFLTLPMVYSVSTQNAPGASLREQLWSSLTPRSIMFTKFFSLLGSSTERYKAVMAMHECGFTPQILETLPEAVLAPLQDIIFMCQANPPPSWSKGLLSLVSRTDVSSVLRPGKPWRALASEINAPSHVAKWDFRMLCQHLDDFHNQVEETAASERQAVVRSLFREDRRLSEAQSILSTTKARVIRLDPKPEWSESDYLEQQKELVATVATSTLATPSGRGLLYFALRYPLLTQKYQIGGFQLTCLVKPVNNTVGVDKALFTEEKINWAFFHQGVAGGLAISPHAKGIDTSWILYNKPGQDLNNRHAGFLLALGLNGHLKSVAKWVAFKYLTPKHPMTSIGLLLGLAASYLGTMDSLITRLLSVHVTRMLPRGAAELNLSKHTQTTGIMGIGLLYCNSQHRRMSEIMMSEIEHTDDAEEEDPLRDEGYRLAAGFALGFINLGNGNDLKGLRDMRLTEKLLTIATSVKRVEIAHVLDRSAAGAVVAIMLIFMKSEDQIVARKINIPDTVLQYDYVRPDILLLRTVAYNIILWSRIEPSFEWVKRGLPADYRSKSLLTSTLKLQTKDMPFFSILAGLCFSLGLRFAGSANLQVRDLLVHYLDEFMRIVRTPATTFDAEMAKGNACMCQDLLALSCATVMAGTGDIVVLRRLRSLHGRDDPNTTYGSHFAAHLAIGALFLGCGTATFGTSNLATAALIVAFYPLFPTTVQDNRSHLQAFRHFWVLATEPRCLVVKDLATGQPINAPVLVHLKAGSPSAKAVTAKISPRNASDLKEPLVLRRQTPCLLPPLDDVHRVVTDASSLGYWDLTIDFAGVPGLMDDFRQNQSVYLKRRPAHEGTFRATLRALGSVDVSVSAGDEAGNGRDPLEWVFSLEALKDLTYSERAVVLDRLGSGGGVGEGEGSSTAVDARLVLRSGLDGWSRDRLLGLRLLFEWAERRAAFAGVEESNSESHGDPVGKNLEEAAETSSAGKGKNNKGKGAVGSSKGKKVSMSVNPPAMIEEEEEDEDKTVTDPVAYHEKNLDAVEMSEIWWMRDSAIEELKGKAWLAARVE